MNFIDRRIPFKTSGSEIFPSDFNAIPNSTGSHTKAVPQFRILLHTADKKGKTFIPIKINAIYL